MSSKATSSECEKANVDLHFRDRCAHLLIPLNQCRRKEFYRMDKCGEQRHAFEKCQYEEYVKRVGEKLAKKRAAERAEWEAKRA